MLRHSIKTLSLNVIALVAIFATSQGQVVPKDSIIPELNEIIVSANKFPEKKKNIAQKIDLISAQYINRANTQNTGDLLQSAGNIFVQKSQQGGSSPVIRGFEASRVLLIVDGVRMNNLIYRSGHLQNVITVDQNMLESIEVLYGPSSTLYGSDALGGAVHFRTKMPQLAQPGKSFFISGNHFTRYSSANHEKTLHSDINIGGEKWAWLQSYTFSDFGDMRMGSQYPEKYPSFGKRDSFVSRINGVDTVLKNSNPNLQKFSGYQQWDILQKFLFKPSASVTHSLNLQLSNTNNVPRYDRLQDKRDFGGNIGRTLRWAEWSYGPQTRFFSAYELKINPSRVLDQMNLNVNYQYIEESRLQRQFRAAGREARVEKVNVLGLNLDIRKNWGQHELTTGADVQFSNLRSIAKITNVNTGIVSNLADTRYPNGKNNMLQGGFFAQHIYKFKNKKILLNDGLRLQYSNLYSSIADNSFRNLPYTVIRQNNTALTGNLGFVFLPSQQQKIATNFSVGFRVPNVDDLAKIFESGTTGGIQQVVVPNPDIKPERTYNIDINYLQAFGKHFRMEASAFYTRFTDALVKVPFTYNGQDSVLYNGVKSQVLANVNANRAFLYGFSAGLHLSFQSIVLSSTINYTEGRFETDENKPSSIYEQQTDGSYKLVKKKVSSKPLDHIPPLFGKTSIAFQKHKWSTELFCLYNGWKRLDDYNADGEDNAQYATPEGMPAWFTLNMRTSFQITPKLLFQFAAENLLDRNYRVFASGFSAPGRNFVITLRLRH
ncbi:MAG: TonB-dependent receptor [Bacteroidetes bacterium]|nr:TonB-dependent receptor [Bacteroidota bacterium]